MHTLIIWASIIALSLSGMAFLIGLKYQRQLAPFLSRILDRCLSEPEVNSRLVFLVVGVVTALGMLAISIAFIFVADRELFPTMIGTLGASGVGAGFGRYLTKAGDGKQGDNNAPPAKT